MTELQTSAQGTKVMNVYVEGDKNGFNSKSALQKFKLAIKETPEYNLFELKQKFVKEDYLLELVSKTDTDVKFTLSTKSSHNPEQPSVDNEKSELKNKREVLKARIEMMRKNRTNESYHKAKTSVAVPKEILDEYLKLKKIAKVPIPEPAEILENPDQYKQMLTMVLGNSMMKQLGANHPYNKYFKLLAKKLGVSEPEPFPMQDFTNKPATVSSNIENLMKMSGSVTDIKGNELSKDEDTDTEEEEEKSIEV